MEKYVLMFMFLQVEQFKNCSIKSASDNKNGNVLRSTYNFVTGNAK